MPNYVPIILKLAQYECWTNLQMLDFWENQSEEVLHRDFGFGLRTPHHTLFHIANVMRTWSLCVQPIQQDIEPLPYDPDLSLSALRSWFQDLDTNLQLAISEAHDQGVLDQDHRLNHAFHLVTHGTHHRGQLLSMVTLLGHGQPFEGGDFGGWSREN